jgi:hypothetical protein
VAGEWWGELVGLQAVAGWIVWLVVGGKMGIFFYDFVYGGWRKVDRLWMQNGGGICLGTGWLGLGHRTAPLLRRRKCLLSN